MVRQMELPERFGRNQICRNGLLEPACAPQVDNLVLLYFGKEFLAVISESIAESHFFQAPPGTASFGLDRAVQRR